LERLYLKDTVGQSEGRGSSEVTRSIFYDGIGVDLLKGGFKVYVWKDFDETLVKRVCAQKSSRDVL
jgi:hypothetical protein